MSDSAKKDARSKYPKATGEKQNKMQKASVYRLLIGKPLKTGKNVSFQLPINPLIFQIKEKKHGKPHFK